MVHAQMLKCRRITGFYNGVRVSCAQQATMIQVSANAGLRGTKSASPQPKGKENPSTAGWPCEVFFFLLRFWEMKLTDNRKQFWPPPWKLAFAQATHLAWDDDTHRPTLQTIRQACTPLPVCLEVGGAGSHQELPPHLPDNQQGRIDRLGGVVENISQWHRLRNLLRPMPADIFLFNTSSLSWHWCALGWLRGRNIKPKECNRLNPNFTSTRNDKINQPALTNIDRTDKTNLGRGATAELLQHLPAIPVPCPSAASTPWVSPTPSSWSRCKERKKISKHTI